MVCALLSHDCHVTSFCVMSHCDVCPATCDIPPLCSKSKRRKEKKRNINNDLAVLPSHDNWHREGF